jgi:Fungal Zn(2)-Cys(6) binuclear cluster domain
MNSSSSPASASAATTRAHACLLCQQRKVKCSRETPCSGCIKSRAECVYRDPAPPRRRKRRNPEDVLLARLKRYEQLLENAGVKVDPIGRTNSGAVEDEQIEEPESRQTSTADNFTHIEVGKHDATSIPFGDSLSTETSDGTSANPARFVVEEGRSRYLEK